MADLYVCSHGNTKPCDECRALYAPARCICGMHNNCPEGDHTECECLCVNDDEAIDQPTQEIERVRKIVNDAIDNDLTFRELDELIK